MKTLVSVARYHLVDRLTYVALSRCQVMLYLTYCETRRRTDAAGAGSLDMRKPSRYLRALPPNLVHVAS